MRRRSGCSGRAEWEAGGEVGQAGVEQLVLRGRVVDALSTVAIVMPISAPARLETSKSSAGRPSLPTISAVISSIVWVSLLRSSPRSSGTARISACRSRSCSSCSAGRFLSTSRSAARRAWIGVSRRAGRAAR